MKKIIIPFLIVLLFACNSNDDNKPMSKQDSLAADSLAWIETINQNTVNAYNEFINQHPDSKYSDEANKKILNLQEDSLWQITISQNNIDAYRKFCTTYPTSVHHGEAYDKVNAILKSNVDGKYKKMVDFIEEMSTGFSYSTLAKYKADDFHYIKVIKNNTQAKLKDSVLITDNKEVEKYLNKIMFETCYKMYNESYDNYDLLCSPTEISIVFHRSCADIAYEWLVNDDNMKLKNIRIYQDVLTCP